MTQPVATIESLDHEGRGIARIDGKVTFVEGALPGERVTIEVNRRKPRFDSASPVAVLEQSFIRVEPRCPHFGNCGGCSMQHVDPAAQVAIKQRILEDALRHIGNVAPECMLPPIHGLPWGYRQRARLSARYVAKKGGALVGFHEKRSSFLVDMRSCDVLPARISALIMPLRKLVSGLSIRDRLPQIELAAGDTADVLVFRVLQPPTAEDEARFREFADASGVQVWLQPGGPETAFRLHPAEAPELAYRLPEFDVTMPFHPTEFTQVNMAVNRVLVRRTMGLLDPRPGERVADFFCGLGNFTLPIARSGAQVIGYEGSAQLVKRAAQNAARNGLEARTEFRAANLFQATPEWLAAQGRFDKVLIDPPRDGAVELVKRMDPAPIRRIVYVSCNPATLARDAAVLVHTKGYRLVAAGVANMFPHTAHVESIVLFEA